MGGGEIARLSRVNVATARRSCRKAPVAVALSIPDFDKVMRHLLPCLAREGGSVVERFPRGKFGGPPFVTRRSGQDISTVVPTLANLRALLENARGQFF
jgi:hypothetical protein